MIAKRQIWNYTNSGQVWAGKYKNSHNLPHWHYDCELVCVERGTIDVFCDKRKFSLSRSQSLFIDSGQLHYMKATEKDTVLLMFIFDYRLIEAFADKLQLASPKLSRAYACSALYEDVRKILAQKKPFAVAEAACAITRFMIDVFRNESLVPRVKSDSESSSFRQLLEEINQKYEFYSFDDAVSFLGMSPAYFSRYFKATTGVTFSRYLNYVRTANAVRILQTERDASATSVAERCGFGTIRNFNRIFKLLTGHTPTGLPSDFSLNNPILYASGESSDPTLFGCELLESTWER